MTKRCVICGRKEGSTKDRCGEEDGIPLGPVERCETCGRLACPDCAHEADCCFADAENHRGEPAWAPRGWVVTDHRTAGMVCYERQEPAEGGQP